MNTFKEVRDRAPLDKYVLEHLEHVNGRPVCPFCNSGNGETANSDSAFFVNPHKPWRWTCFSCGRSGDVFDLADEVEHLNGSKPAQLNAVKAWIGGNGPTSPCKQRAPLAGTARPNYSTGRRAAREYVLSCIEHVKDPECLSYLESRGFDENDASRFHIGYDHEKRMVVLPYPGSTYYYIGRLLNGRKLRYVKPRASEVGKEPPFNPEALKGPAVFVVEGQFDALAIMKLGFPAVSTGGTSGRHLLASQVRSLGSDPLLLVLPDKDEPGLASAKALNKTLATAGANSRIVLPPEQIEGKDANDWMLSDRDALRKYLALAIDSL